MASYKIPPHRRADFYERMVAFVNSNEFFWSTDMRRGLNIVYSNATTNPYERLMSGALKKLKEVKLIGVSEVKGSIRQYYKIERNILLTDITLEYETNRNTNPQRTEDADN